MYAGRWSGAADLAGMASGAGTASATLAVPQNVALSGSAAAASAAQGSLAGDFTWLIADNDTLNTGANTTTQLAIGVPGGAIAYASPDLIRGQTLQLSGSALNLVGNADVPTIDHDRSSLAIGEQWRIEVMDSDYAVAQNMRTGVMYGPGYSVNYSIQVAVDQMQTGDTVCISPGYVAPDGGNWTGAGFWGADNALVCLRPGSIDAVVGADNITVKNFPGRGRWKLRRPTDANNRQVSYASGLLIGAPTELGGRKTITVEGFDFDWWGVSADAYGVRVRQFYNTDGSDPSTSWNDYHASLSFRNFKVGKTDIRAGSGSGFLCASENLLFENGHVFDCGGSTEHNFYLSGRFVTMRGVRTTRSRRTWMDEDMAWHPGSSGTGHLVKTRCAGGLFEGCIFDTYENAPVSMLGMVGADANTGNTTTSQHTALLQIANGGDYTVQGCAFINSNSPHSARGLLRYSDESIHWNIAPFDWNSRTHRLIVRRNVFINRYVVYDINWPGSMVNIWQDYRGYLNDPANGAFYTVPVEPEPDVQIYDNIGSHLNNNPSAWIIHPPHGIYPGSPSWSTNNSSVTYTPGDEAWMIPYALDYRLKAGAPVATGPAVNTYSFVFPHGAVQRNNNLRGIG